MRVAGILALPLLPLLLGAETSSVPSELRGASLIDSVVARVDRHPITRSQLDLEARLALARHGEVAKAEGPLGGPQLTTSLDYLIDQMLLAIEAERLGVFEITEQAAQAEQRALVQQFPSPQRYQAFVDRFGLTPDLLEGSLRRALRADRYLSDRLRVQAQAGADPAAIQVAARAIVGQLRSRSDIRILARFSDSPPTPAAPPPDSPGLAPAARALRP